MSYESADVLVTGSSGHLGHALMLSLPALNYTPIGVDVLPSEHTTFVGSIASPEFLIETFEKCPLIKHIIHTATLHKPHVESHTKLDFIQVNITGTQNLLDLSRRHFPHLKSFVFISTTSTYGLALSPTESSPAAWIDETTVPIPKNIYGVTKCAAEDLCFLHHRQTHTPVVVLKVSRFFPEGDDDETRRSEYTDDELKVGELLYRRADIADMVGACVRAMDKADELKWAKLIISGPTIFDGENEADLRALNAGRAAEVIARLRPDEAAILKRAGWKLPRKIDRVYDSSKAVRELGWRPEYTFERAVAKIQRGEEWRSDLAVRVGRRGYHAVPTGIYTT